MFDYPADITPGYQSHVPKTELICNPQTVVTERRDLDSSKFVIKYKANCAPSKNQRFQTKIQQNKVELKFKQKDGKILK